MQVFKKIKIRCFGGYRYNQAIYRTGSKKLKIDPEWLSRELERREIAFMNGSIKATTREDLNKRLSEKWNEKKAD